MTPPIRKKAVEYMSGATAREFLDDMTAILRKSKKLSAAYNAGKPLFDNYNWRAVAVAAVLQKVEPRLKILRARTGVDCTIGGECRNIELKTATSGSGRVTVSASEIKAEFDKQNHVDALEKLRRFDGLIVALFNDEEATPVITIWIKKPGMKVLEPVLEAKHRSFQDSWTGRGRDSISLGFDDLKRVSDDDSVVFIHRRKSTMSELATSLAEGIVQRYENE